MNLTPPAPVAVLRWSLCVICDVIIRESGGNQFVQPARPGHWHWTGRRVLLFPDIFTNTFTLINVKCDNMNYSKIKSPVLESDLGGAGEQAQV